MNIRGLPLSREKICSLASIVRKQCGVGNNLYFPVVQVIEWGLCGSDEFNYIIVPDDEMRDIYGTTNTAENIMKIREDVYIGAINGNTRDRFTLCHELGHYLLHQPQLISYARGNVPIYCQPEWQANTFAAEIMAPHNLIVGLSVEEISDKCGISYSAAKIQQKFAKKIAS
ncbi:ImmA/IrrE family metallo-endopeptidase [uncultured Thomasclavelia sp.]|uniref:ImmA/IrrE family metallo-endopeptidase n=1 Tax=uncultured Thomasclavelia sp. TaxID=3025759 RepID=UPI00280B54D3|nr:ImmA/IrrE family metallo-endopeptidase [uncultured Thomasclavelia sp.]